MVFVFSCFVIFTLSGDDVCFSCSLRKSNFMLGGKYPNPKHDFSAMASLGLGLKSTSQRKTGDFSLHFDDRPNQLQ